MKWGRKLKRLPFELPENKDGNGVYNDVFFIDNKAVRVTSEKSLKELDFTVKEFVNIVELQQEMSKDKLAPEVFDCFVHDKNVYTVMERMKCTLTASCQMESGLMDIKKINQQVKNIEKLEKKLWNKYRIIRGDRHHENIMVDFDNQIRLIDFDLDYQVPTFINDKFIMSLNKYEKNSISSRFLTFFSQDWIRKMNVTKGHFIEDITDWNHDMREEKTKQILKHQYARRNTSTKINLNLNELKLDKDVYFPHDITFWSALEDVARVKKNAGMKLLRKDTGTRAGKFSHQSFFETYYPGRTSTGKKLKLILKTMTSTETIIMMKTLIPLLKSLHEKKLFPAIVDIFYNDSILYIITEFGGPNVLMAKTFPRTDKMNQAVGKIVECFIDNGVYPPEYIPLISKGKHLMLANDISLNLFIDNCAIWPQSISKSQRKSIEKNPLQKRIFSGLNIDYSLTLYEYHKNRLTEILKSFNPKNKKMIYGLATYMFDNELILDRSIHNWHTCLT